jgi:hypothetical protein
MTTLIVSVAVMSCVKSYLPAKELDQTLMQQRDPISISLARPWSGADCEYSGAAVYGDSIVLMPQYPERFGNRIPMFARKDLLGPNLDHAEQTPRVVRFNDDGLARTIEGFEGFEALAFLGNDVFLTIESHRSAAMMGYLVRGRIIFSNSSLSIKLDATTLTELPPRANLGNTGDEAIVTIPGGRLMTFFEANGANVVRNPFAFMFDVSGDKIKKLANIPIPNIEYRITDCSPMDHHGHFWCINCMYPGDYAKLNPARDFFAERWGNDRSQTKSLKAANKVVERLIELEFDGATVKPAENSPIYFKLRSDGLLRNWEGLAFVPGQEFFLATDKYPGTIFAFVRMQSQLNFHNKQ